MRRLRGTITFICVLGFALQGCLRVTNKVNGTSGNNTSAPVTAVKGVAMEDFTFCHPMGSGMANCLSNRGVLPDTWSQASLDPCLTTAYPTAFDSAQCATASGYTVFHYRAPFQSDMDKCATKVGNSKIAGCLNKNGVLPATGLTQADIDSCVAANGGPNGLEKCLRARNILPKKAALYQSDLNLCNKVDGQSFLANCLINNDLLASTVTQANVDACITAVGVGSAVKCLRNNRFVPNALMQVHVNLCNTAVGQAGIATCLDNNGLLEGGVQADVDSCVTAVGIGSVARCFRNRGLIPNQLLQAHLNSCNTAAGQAGIFNCLNANGLLAATTTVTQGEIDTCVTTAGLTGVVRCLAVKKLIPDFVSQPHINGCNRYGGQANIVTCLNGSGVLPVGVTQAQIDTCITNVGLANVYTCLNNTGAIVTFATLTAAGGILTANCSSCHNGTLLRGNMDVAVYASVFAKVVAGDPVNSRLDQRINNAAMPMPPTGLMVQANRDRIRTWITQGARNN